MSIPRKPKYSKFNVRQSQCIPRDTFKGPRPTLNQSQRIRVHFAIMEAGLVHCAISHGHELESDE